MTRIGMQCGLAGVYLLGGGAADLAPGVLPAGRHEMALVIQDRSFPRRRHAVVPGHPQAPFGDTPPDGPWIPTTDVCRLLGTGSSFGDTIVVNGRTWPRLTVSPAATGCGCSTRPTPAPCS